MKTALQEQNIQETVGEDSNARTEYTGDGWWRQQCENRIYRRRLVETAMREQNIQETVGEDINARTEYTGDGW